MFSQNCIIYIILDILALLKPETHFIGYKKWQWRCSGPNKIEPIAWAVYPEGIPQSPSMNSEEPGVRHLQRTDIACQRSALKTRENYKWLGRSNYPRGLRTCQLHLSNLFIDKTLTQQRVKTDKRCQMQTSRQLKTTYNLIVAWPRM